MCLVSTGAQPWILRGPWCPRGAPWKHRRTTLDPQGRRGDLSGRQWDPSGRQWEHLRSIGGAPWIRWGAMGRPRDHRAIAVAPPGGPRGTPERPGERPWGHQGFWRRHRWDPGSLPEIPAPARGGPGPAGAGPGPGGGSGGPGATEPPKPHFLLKMLKSELFALFIKNDEILKIS